MQPCPCPLPLYTNHHARRTQRNYYSGTPLHSPAGPVQCPQPQWCPDVIPLGLCSRWPWPCPCHAELRRAKGVPFFVFLFPTSFFGSNATPQHHPQSATFLLVRLIFDISHGRCFLHPSPASVCPIPSCHFFAAPGLSAAVLPAPVPDTPGPPYMHK